MAQQNKNGGFDRSNLIQQLAKEYGMTGRKKSEEGTHFDHTTGTLFIGSKVYKHSDLTEAKQFMEENKKKMSLRNDAASDYYEIGAAAVDFLINESLGNSGRIVLKNDKTDNE